MTHQETAIKELEEEIGLKIQFSQLHLIESGKNADENHLHFYESYVLLFTGNPQDLSFTDGEIAEAKWMSIRDYQQERVDHLEKCCNGISADNYNRIQTWLKNQ